jgi:hypothetical protein
MPPTLTSLPAEIQLTTLDFLDLQSLKRMHRVNQLFCYTITKDRLLKDLTKHERELTKHEPEMLNFNYLEDLTLPCYTCFSILPVGRFSSICLAMSVRCYNSGFGARQRVCGGCICGTYQAQGFCDLAHELRRKFIDQPFVSGMHKRSR